MSDNGTNHIVKIVSVGELLGQHSLINDDAVDSTATALEDMRVCFIPKSEIINLLQTNNNFLMEILKATCNNLKETDNNLVNMAQTTVRERLVYTLIYLSETFGKEENNVLKIKLSREELSGLVGTATENCIRILVEFKKQGLIDLKGKVISIKNERALRRILS